MPNVTREQIINRATPQSYSRGESYYHADTIFNPILRKNKLECHCTGSDYTPYHVYVTFDENDKIIAAGCTCPYDWGGDCKHIVALLLTYLNEPERFQEHASIQEKLNEYTKEELIDLIEEMISRNPDLHNFVNRPRPGQKKQTPVDLEPIRRELAQAFTYFGEWGDHTIEWTISSVESTGVQFAQREDWKAASLIFRTIVEESLEEDYYLLDDEGQCIAALNSVLDELVMCLEQTSIVEDDTERQAIFDRLLDAYIWEIDNGGCGLGDGILPDAFLSFAKPDDLPHIRTRVLEAQSSKSNQEYGHWAVEAYERFLIQLDALSEPDPETMLQRLCEKNLHWLLFEKLMEMRRYDEAVTVVSEHLQVSYRRVQALSQLVEVGYDKQAIQLAQASLKEEYDERILEWLANRYKETHDNVALFELLLDGMARSPSIHLYAALTEASGHIPHWPKVRPRIIASLENGRNHALLTKIYLHDEEWDSAWAELEKTKGKTTFSRYPVVDSSLEMTVAHHSQHARPCKAIPVYVKHARQQISRKNRQHYSEAARLLSTVKALYHQLDDDEAWNMLIGELREEFRRLPALQDELNRAGL